MDFTEKMANVEPVRLGPKSKFKFKCHPGVKCFTKCCRGINIILTPYDIIRLKNRLGLSSDDFLTLYTEPQILEKTGLPVVTLKLLEDEGTGGAEAGGTPETAEEKADRKACPFVRVDGCIVYEDRPTTCRYYPLGVASLSHKEDVDGEEFYFFVNEPHCLGFEEDEEWTVEAFRKDQGVDDHDRINAEWTDLVVRKRSFPPNLQLTEQTKQMFFLVSYNIDKFKDFVFKSSFLDRYDVEEENLEKIKDDELALLEFGLKWVKWLLFKQGDFKMKPGADGVKKG